MSCSHTYDVVGIREFIYLANCTHAQTYTHANWSPQPSRESFVKTKRRQGRQKTTCKTTHWIRYHCPFGWRRYKCRYHTHNTQMQLICAGNRDHDVNSLNNSEITFIQWIRTHKHNWSLTREGKSFTPRSLSHAHFEKHSSHSSENAIEGKAIYDSFSSANSTD